MELIRELNKKLGITIVMVLHDLNQASQYSDRVLVLRDGKKYIEGEVKRVLTKELVREIYRVESEVEYYNGVPYFKLRGLA